MREAIIRFERQKDDVREGTGRGSIRIVSHNVFWFQGAPFATDRPGAPNDAVIAGLIDLYKQLDADVYCIQEIQDASTARRLAESLDLSWMYMPGAGFPQYGGAIFSQFPMASLSESSPSNMDVAVESALGMCGVEADLTDPISSSGISMKIPEGRVMLY